ncbi:hypothetical protein B0T20DRAFT_418216 [Sordaria brevicollis]|uniref:Uncharacterized protein n=1 Tax=Sordaria brevicollis TaxID=83679 RepID=A0AAE0PB61_SORBR|nr:hypothetical protein B0T20DRAFT_418216 [Sordaria brevicollis]
MDVKTTIIIATTFPMSSLKCIWCTQETIPSTSQSSSLSTYLTTPKPFLSTNQLSPLNTFFAIHVSFALALALALPLPTWLLFQAPARLVCCFFSFHTSFFSIPSYEFFFFTHLLSRLLDAPREV